jgi:hypothetical protein
MGGLGAGWFAVAWRRDESRSIEPAVQRLVTLRMEKARAEIADLPDGPMVAGGMGGKLGLSLEGTENKDEIVCG